jgi:oxygen-independent coproporphyrinogen-3 oxidase
MDGMAGTPSDGAVLSAGSQPPADGALPAAASLAAAAAGELSWYLHVPYCASRCGYCDFNTYTAEELVGAPRSGWADAAIAEVRLARRVLGDLDLPAPTVFIGGGTPTLLPPADLGRVVRSIAAEFGLADGAEVTVEANPDNLTAAVLDGLRAAGADRLSIGMQSADPRTLQVLERTHRADELPGAVHRARAAGFRRLSLDVIYGTPGEDAQQWQRTLDAVTALDPDHVSAYCLGIEPGTRLGAALRAGRIAPVDPDEAADRYHAADEHLARHGYTWYEISNWARPGQQCRHNLVYWRSGSWWGAGPGAHSHIGGVRWWNRKHPAAWTAALRAGTSPAAGREVLDRAAREQEAVLLGLRLAEGLPLAALPAAAVPMAAGWVADGLAERCGPDRVVLTRRGRLLADGLALQALA